MQRGELISSIETPVTIVAQYPRKLYAANAANNYELLETLRKNPAVHTAYIFGDALHVTFHGEADQNISGLQEIDPTIEDCFINLMNR
jgi:hypothetical protein